MNFPVRLSVVAEMSKKGYQIVEDTSTKELKFLKTNKIIPYEQAETLCQSFRLIKPRSTSVR